MTSRIKQQQLVEDMTERYKRLGTYRAVAGELDNKFSCALIQQVVEHKKYSPGLAKLVGIQTVDVRWSPRCTVELRDAINEECDRLDITHSVFLERLVEWWFAVDIPGVDNG